jgi:DNA polymerase-3 subunit alpha
MFLIYDTETTGLPRDWNAPLTDSDNWPRLVQLAWQLHDGQGKLISRGNRIVRPDGFTIPFNATKVHGITTERAEAEGLALADVIDEFDRDLARATHVMGHNIEFDINIVGAELHRLQRPLEPLTEKPLIDSKDEATNYCAIPGGRGGQFKWPSLTELHAKLFGEPFAEAHDAAYDVDATAKCFFELCRIGVIQRPGLAAADAILYEAPKLEAANFQASKKATEPSSGKPKVTATDIQALEEVPFVHLHVHSQFSILQAVSKVGELVDAAADMGMPAIAVTDTGNMMAAFQFVRAANKKGIKPIVGAELNVCRNRLDKSQKDDGYPMVFLAKNKTGYHQLAKFSSAAYTEGFYYVPRIDKELIASANTEDIIVTTGGLFSEVPSLILNVGEAQAEEAFLWWRDKFGDNFYAELNRHGLEEERVVNDTLLKFCEKHGVKYIAANNSYYTRKDQAEAHDILLCVKDAANVSKPKKYIGKRGREFRFGMPNDEWYLKSPTDMKRLFADLPEAIQNTARIEAECEGFSLERDVLLPAFDIPEEFRHPEDEKDGGKRGENAYLRHLTYQGAAQRYGEINDETRARLDFELETIERTGYPGYFLIVQDFTKAAREMGVSVGPGRGSAAGSAVAYCTGITNVDPIKYDLLFERFLNPDRVSLPDIDIDFDDEGRGRVIEYVINKYGANQVAQIITYGTMAAKSSIRDTARVLELPLPDADRIAKTMPDISLAKLFSLDDKTLRDKLKGNEGLEMANAIKKIAGAPGLEGQTVQTARVLEGSVRNTGIHACGVIITPSDITEFVPIATAKDSDMACTQFDNAVAEDAGLLKMDFLGLKTLTIIKDAVRNVKDSFGLDLDPDSFPLDDEKTYELFQRGDTIGIFQYESAGMQKYLKELRPTEFADLIAMNALYRPGPLEYIPSFIRRKHGKEPITYDIDACEEYLQETYGITVYQEQVMLLSQKLAGFTKGEADTLRKAMGKKKADLIAKMKPQFLEQGGERGHDKPALEKIWKDWEAFASYAFNKSHSTCYAWVAYQTAYLKANYPAQFMAAVLSNNMNDIKSVTLFMEESRRMGIPVKGPSVNESAFKFRVNEEGAIRFGLGAIRGVGEGAVHSIVENRIADGPYQSVFDFARRVNPKDVNKRVYEALAMGGGFDGFAGLHRAQFFAQDEKGRSLIELAVRYGAGHQESEASAQASLFGDAEVEIPEPAIPVCEPWETMDALSKEKEVIGVYISGHPLDKYRFETQHLCSSEEGLQVLLKPADLKGKDLRFAGRIIEAQHRIAKSGKPFGSFTLEDYHHSERFMLFGEDYLRCKDYLVEGWFVFVRGAVDKRRFSDDPDDVEFKVKTIELLADVREKMVGRMRLMIDLVKLDQTRLDSLTGLVESHPGGVGLTLEVMDDEARMTMVSRTRKIELTDEFLEGLESLEQEGGLAWAVEVKR